MLKPWPDDPEFLGAMRDLALRDFWFFCREVVGVTIAEEEPHRALCRFMERRSERGRKLVLMPRGSLKTTICTQAYSLWKIAKDPSVRILLDSNTRANAKTFARVVRWHLEANERFRQLFGDLVRQPGWTEDYFTVRRPVESREPTVMTAGMDQTVVSQHYDLIIADDLVDHTNVTTPEQIQRTIEHYRLLLPLLEIPQINPNAELVVVGTRWDDSDLYGYLLRESGLDYHEAVQYLRMEGGSGQVGQWAVFLRGAYREDGSPLCSLYTREFLDRRRRELGEYHFSAQYLNDPVPEESAAFRREWFRYWKPPLPDGLRVVAVLDPAISQRRHGDYSAIVVVGLAEDGRRYLLHCWRARASPKELVDRLFSIFEEYQPEVVGIESVSFQQAMRYILDEEMSRRGIWMPVRPLVPDFGATKEMRIRALQPLYESGQILHPDKRLPWAGNVSDLELELLRFPRGHHDDLADALAYHVHLLRPHRAKKPLEYRPDSYVTGY